MMLKTVVLYLRDEEEILKKLKFKMGYVVNR